MTKTNQTRYRCPQPIKPLMMKTLSTFTSLIVTLVTMISLWDESTGFGEWFYDHYDTKITKLWVSHGLNWLTLATPGSSFTGQRLHSSNHKCTNESIGPLKNLLEVHYKALSYLNWLPGLWFVLIFWLLWNCGMFWPLVCVFAFGWLSFIRANSLFNGWFRTSKLVYAVWSFFFMGLINIWGNPWYCYVMSLIGWINLMVLKLSTCISWLGF